MSETVQAAGQWIPHPYAYGAHSPERRQFSVLCWRGWCDSDYRDREVGMMSGGPVKPGTLPHRQCPTPDTCQCECHDVAATGKRVITKRA